MPYFRERQRGTSLMGFLFFLILIIFAVTVTLKLGPHYMGYLTVRSVMQDLREDPSLFRGTKREIADTIDKRLYINGVEVVHAKDFKLKKTEKGYGVSLDYQVQEHLFGNLDVVLKFGHRVEVGSE